MLNFLVNTFDIFVEITVVLIFIRVILSWFGAKSRFFELLTELTEPVLAPIRKILPKTSFIDFSPIVAIILLQGLQYLIHYLAKIPY